MPALRIMNAAGMVAWRTNTDGEPEQRLRLIHPLSWIWIAALTIYSTLAQGIPDTIKELKQVWQKETVWF
jgi:hypothetical protein